jgi:hypothetical protein
VDPRLFLLVLSVYVTLDLSLPAMPGAFVFEPAGSVETTQKVSRARVPSPIVAAALPCAGPHPVPHLADSPGPPRGAHLERPWIHPSPPPRLPRADAAPPAEEPH